MVAVGQQNEEVDLASLSGTRKAAILLMAMNQDAAAAVLRRLDRDVVEEVTREIANLDQVAPSLRAAVINEFYNLVMARRYIDMGGMPLARALLMKTLPPEEARKA
ncbi:MAG: hypothetical protein D6744_09810, partial [Planctomycetota bacterium]